MRVFDFDHAIVRSPGRSVVDGLRSAKDGALDFAEIAAEHRGYIAALRAADLKVDVLGALEGFPDSVFVEDPALVFAEGAILLRPGAVTRRGESAAIEAALRQHFDRILHLEGDEYADGGDVLVAPDTVFIGLSARTSRAGAVALHTRLRELGRHATIVETPQTVLHLKSASALLDDSTIFATEALAQSGMFARFDVVRIPAGEEAAANLVRVNDAILLDDRFPRTIDLIAKRGVAVVPLHVREIARLDAGLSCMSLRWRRAQLPTTSDR